MSAPLVTRLQELAIRIRPNLPEHAALIEEAIAALVDSADGLRDQFAAAALTGWIAMHADSNAEAPSPPSTAQRSYDYADAMLAAREKKE